MFTITTMGMTTDTNMSMDTVISTCSAASADPLARLRLWQLISPALPVGAFAWSQGQEFAVESGWVRDEAGAAAWIGGLLRHPLAQQDVPVLARCHAAWQQGDHAAAEHWSRRLLAMRESAELREEDRQLGAALARLLTDLGVAPAERWTRGEPASFACLFALASVHWHVPLEEAAQGYLWAWCENQVAAAIKLIPLGQTAGQRLLSTLIEHIPAAVTRGLAVDDDDIGYSAPGVALASALHETQYTRLFRS
jgi:urease accessory protein